MYLGALKMKQLANILRNYAEAGPRETLSISIGTIFVLVGIVLFACCLPALTFFWCLSRGLAKGKEKLNFPVEFEGDAPTVSGWDATKLKEKKVTINGDVVEPAKYDGKKSKKDKE
jgi:hypothetical protein